jgi:hypothetical protein
VLLGRRLLPAACCLLPAACAAGQAVLKGDLIMVTLLPATYFHYAQAVLKGDLMYRKLLGDCQFDAAGDFSALLWSCSGTLDSVR